jgi:hypothetical protein
MSWTEMDIQIPTENGNQMLKRRNSVARFDVLTAMRLRIQVFWDVILCWG